MTKLFRIAAVVALPVLVSTAQAQTSVTGSYSATASVTSGNTSYDPTINVGTSGTNLPSPFTESLTVGSTTAATDFIVVQPLSGPASVGTVAGTVAVDFNFSGTGGLGTVKSVSSSDGNGSLVSGGTYNGQVSVTGYYELYYGTSPQTDCIVWSNTVCTTNISSGSAPVTSDTVGDTLTITFTNNAVLQVNMYNWTDWNMSPNISFNLVAAPHSVPEPASLAVFATSLAAMGVIRRRRVRRESAARSAQG
jgi:hypothetical protein